VLLAETSLRDIYLPNTLLVGPEIRQPLLESLSDCFAAKALMLMATQIV